MFTKQEQRTACLTLAIMVEKQVESYYVDITDVYSEVHMHFDTFKELREANIFLNILQPFELKKQFGCQTTRDGKKFYTLRLRVVDYKKK